MFDVKVIFNINFDAFSYIGSIFTCLFIVIPDIFAIGVLVYILFKVKIPTYLRIIWFTLAIPGVLVTCLFFWINILLQIELRVGQQTPRLSLELFTLLSNHLDPKFAALLQQISLVTIVAATLIYSRN